MNALDRVQFRLSAAVAAGAASVPIGAAVSTWNTPDGERSVRGLSYPLYANYFALDPTTTTWERGLLVITSATAATRTPVEGSNGSTGMALSISATIVCTAAAADIEPAPPVTFYASGSYTLPNAGLRGFFLMLIGGGGGGSAGAYTAGSGSVVHAGNGGSAGQVWMGHVPLTALSVTNNALSVTIGAGGAGSPMVTSPGDSAVASSGGYTQFGGGPYANGGYGASPSNYGGTAAGYRESLPPNTFVYKPNYGSIASTYDGTILPWAFGAPGSAPGVSVAGGTGYPYVPGPGGGGGGGSLDSGGTGYAASSGGPGSTSLFGGKTGGSGGNGGSQNAGAGNYGGAGGAGAQPGGGGGGGGASFGSGRSGAGGAGGAGIAYVWPI